MFSQLSRTYLKKAILDGLVLVNNNKVKPNYNLTQNDIVSYDEFRLTYQYTNESPNQIKPSYIPFKIIYEDNDIIVVDKPFGLDSHPVSSNTSGTLLNSLMHYFKQTHQIVKPRLVHRLDKDTSGIVVIAKNYKTCVRLSNLFQNSEVIKVYIALVPGDFSNSINRHLGYVEMSNFLSRDKNNKKIVTDCDPLKGYYASTRFYNIGSPSKFKSDLELENFIVNKISFNASYKTDIKQFLELSKSQSFESSLVLCLPQTGRTHQIRVHLKNLGYPIVGDKLYSNIKFVRMMLHSWAISFQSNIASSYHR